MRTLWGPARWRLGSGRLLALAACLAPAACGRVAFEPLDDAGDAADASDAATPAPTRAITAGWDFSCAVVDDTLRCWGENAVGQLGTGDTTDRTTATVIAPEVRWRSVTAGIQHACGLAADGVVWCWGDNTEGQLGQGDRRARPTPTRVLLPGPAVAIDTMGRSTCALLDDAALVCWGDNAEGQLGQGSSVDALMPVVVAPATRWSELGVGEGHVLAVDANGVRWGSGRNGQAELGLGFVDPTQLRTMTAATDGPWRSLVGGQNHSCGIDVRGALLCWGDNVLGHFGTGDQTDATTPVARADPGPWAQLDTHTFVTCAVSEAGALACAGRNTEGQLGAGDTIDRLLPTRVEPASGWVEVAVGRLHTCAMRDDGSAWCAGDNNVGELGTGDLARRNVFTQVPY